MPIVPMPFAKVLIALIDFNCCGNLSMSVFIPKSLAKKASAAIPANAAAPKPPVISSLVRPPPPPAPSLGACILSLSASLCWSLSL